MSARRSTWDRIADAKRRAPAATPPDDVEMGDYDDEVGDELADREERCKP